MKYSVNINQAGVADAGFADGKTDLIDWAIIDYINTFATNPAAVTQNGRVWINYRHLLDQMPLLGLRTKSALSGRISKLQDLGLLSVDYDADKRLFAKLTARCHDTINFRSSNSTGVRPDEQGVRLDEQGCSSRRTFIRESVLDNQDKKDCANKSRTPKRATQLPDDFEPNDTNQRVAAEHGVDIHQQLPQFRDYHRAKGSTMKDWHAALNTWLRNAKRFDPGPRAIRNHQETPEERGLRMARERGFIQ